MKIPALGDIFTLYRTLYFNEVSRSQSLQSQLTDALNRIDLERARAERAEAERSDTYRQLINWQATSRHQAPIFAPFDGMPDPLPEQEFEPERTSAMTGKEAKAQAMQAFFADIENNFRAQQ